MARLRIAMARGAVAALVLLASVVHGATTSAAATCRARLESAYTSGRMPDNLAALCTPAQGAGDSPEHSWLSDTKLGAEVDIVRYWDLLRLADDIDRAVPKAPLAHALLSHILAQTNVDAHVPPSWWERFKVWLKERLKNNEDVDLSWLDAWVSTLDLHSELLAVVMRVSVVLTLVAALYLVLREIELQGGIGWPWRRKPRRPPRDSRAGKPASAPLSWAEIQALPAAARPAALLRWLLFELHARALLAQDDSLTNREHLGLLGARVPSLHEPFARVLDDIEPCIYGGHMPPAVDELAARVSALRDAATKA